MRKSRKLLALFLTLILAMSIFSACDDEGGGKKGNSTGGADISGTSAAELANVAAKSLTKADSVHISQNAVADVDMNGNNAKVEVNLESDVSVKDKTIHSKGTATSGSGKHSITIDMEYYVTRSGDNAEIYLNVNNTSWMKQSVNVAQLEEMEGFEDALENAKYLIGLIQGVERENTTCMGKSAVLVKGNLDLDDPEGILEKTGLGSNMAQGGLSTSQFQTMLTGLAPVSVSAYLDESNGLPLQIDMDMTEFMTTVYANIAKALGQSLNVSVNTATYNMTFSDYNTVDVAVPDEVKDAINGRASGSMAENPAPDAVMVSPSSETAGGMKVETNESFYPNSVDVSVDWETFEARRKEMEQRYNESKEKIDGMRAEMKGF